MTYKMPDHKDHVNTTKDSIRELVEVESKDLFGARIVEATDPNKTRSVDITLQVYISDYMRGYVEKFYTYKYYDQCMHGHGWTSGGEACNCPIGIPYITEHFFEAGFFIKGVGDGTRIKVQRWRALELLNDWNNNATKEAVHGTYKGDKGRPVRWVYFL